ncbi:hypothetical protein BDV26DRAFT_14599 [Aspergillus bertholletiae]|uniref:Uncharacterized protein n=1 Tax=Aspergillus bertholletiae TaxID=1226010 RepID=A0A5N7B0C8_9EURO|nr:hypothetical protein BDV26DRAFT_14599 [Aspergillus bertholletiae]
MNNAQPGPTPPVLAKSDRLRQKRHWLYVHAFHVDCIQNITVSGVCSIRARINSLSDPMIAPYGTWFRSGTCKLTELLHPCSNKEVGLSRFWPLFLLVPVYILFPFSALIFLHDSINDFCSGKAWRGRGKGREKKKKKKKKNQRTVCLLTVLRQFVRMEYGSSSYRTF